MNKKIHIMQVTFGMDIGGMERVIMDICRHADPDKYKISILCISVRGALADVMESEGFEVLYCEKQDKLSKYLRGIEISKILREKRVDIVHTHHTPAFVHGTIGALLAGNRILINTDHCKNYKTESRLWMRLEKAASYYAKEIVAVSNHTREELIKYEAINPKKLSVIYNGISLKKLKESNPTDIRTEFGIPEGRKIIGSVGRLTYQKGYDLLIESIPDILQHDKDVHFIIVGGGDQHAILQNQIDQMNISDYVTLTGWRTDAINILEAFDCFVSSSIFEGMPMVLLEAMALSKPIITTPVGGIPEVVDNGKTGIVLNSRNKQELSDAIIKLITNPSLACAYGEAGKERYQQYFTAETMVRKYQDIYDKYYSAEMN